MDKLAYTVGNSKSIEESKKRGVYCMECISIVKPDSIKDYYNFNFREVFLEKIWHYGRTTDKMDFDKTFKDRFNLICACNDNFHYPYPMQILTDTIFSSSQKRVILKRKFFLRASSIEISDFKNDTLSFNLYLLNQGNYIKNGTMKFYCKDVDSILTLELKKYRNYK